MPQQETTNTPKDRLLATIEKESQKFQHHYTWLEKAMPPLFFEEVDLDTIMLIAHSLMGFQLQEHFSTIHLKRAAIVICLDSADADLRILKDYALYGIKHYQAYVSHEPFPGTTAPIRIATIFFTEAEEAPEAPLPTEQKEEIRKTLKERNPTFNDEEFNNLIEKISPRFLRSLNINRLALAIEMFFRARTRDNCQYEVRYNEDWQQTGAPSMQIVLAWRNCPKHNFLYRLARTVYRHNLVMKRVNATYIDPYSNRNVLIMSLGLHGSDGRAAWDVADIPDFLRELVTVKYFASFDMIDERLVSKGYITGTMGNFLRAATSFIHQSLVHIDANLYTMENIEEAICRHPELAAQLCAAFKFKFDPHNYNYQTYLDIRERFMEDLKELDTGQEENDIRRKNVLRSGMNFIHHTLKTNFYRLNFTAFSFRLNPAYLDEIPFDRAKKFPVMPYGIFYIKGMHFIGFHIRFKDLSRGGLRTVIPNQIEHVVHERNNVFTECYNLALTQHNKNKDIPEGGSKGVLFLQPFSRLESESLILKREMEAAEKEPDEIEEKLELFRGEQKDEFLYQAQRSYIESLLTIVNCNPDGQIRAKYVVDYWKRPEYLYLGPDENMHDSMIEWIAEFSKKHNYKPGSAFISGKPGTGINHKEYGVTSLGVNVYMDSVLRYLGIDPTKESFSVKLSGGPDGDVAGNQMKNLHKYYPKTAKVVAITDVSGTIRDPEGLDLDILAQLCKHGKPIKFYPPEKLHDGGFLLNRYERRSPTPLTQQTLCWRKYNGKLIEDWISGSEMNQLFRNNMHETPADIFIPAGGRPRTLNASNIHDYLDDRGKPTSRAIIEGANLYLTQEARRFLEEKGCIIIKDSSANKTGVICSSFEVLCGLTLGEKRFIEHKATLVGEILDRLKICAGNEADLLLRTFKESNIPLTEISSMVSDHINRFTYELLDYLDEIPLFNDPNDPLIRCFLNYCLPTLRKHFQKELLQEIPDHHKKAIIASHIAAQLVYRKGLGWTPSIVDILPILLKEEG